MVKNIVAAFDRRIVALDWMAPATKAEARKKLQVLKVGIGYPETWRYAPPTTVRRDDPLGNLQRAELVQLSLPDRQDRQGARSRRMVDDAADGQRGQPAAAERAQFPGGDPPDALSTIAGFDAAANYGAIGAVIGHEISHSFDNLGADFDSTGRLRNWWTPADLARFEAVGQGAGRAVRRV